jgi:MarR family transcriptional regulator, lower aerobic nicotinate degradation pathway regulator
VASDTRKSVSRSRNTRPASRRKAASQASAKVSGGASADAKPIAALYERPGFKLRRANQIALSIFADECRAFNLTTTQFGILTTLAPYSGALDQIGLAQLLGLDRSTTGLVVGLLERRKLLQRTPHPHDRRRQVLALTPEGRRLLVTVAPAVDRAVQRLLEPFSKSEAAIFHALLDRLLEHHNTAVRVPLRERRTNAADEEGRSS